MTPKPPRVFQVPSGVYSPAANWDAVRAPPVPPRTALTPVYETVGGPWNAVLSSYGQRVQVPVPAVPGDVPIGRCEVFPGPPRTRVIQFFGNPYVSGTGRFLVRAVVTYGIGGFQDELVLDFRHGFVLNLLCQSVNVLARFEPPGIDSYDPVPGAVLQFGCTFGDVPVVTGGLSPTFTTRSAELFASGDRVDLQGNELAFARRVFPILGNIAGAQPTLEDFVLEQTDGANNIVFAQTLADGLLANGFTGSRLMSAGVPVIGSAKTVTLRRFQGGPGNEIGALMAELSL